MQGKLTKQAINAALKQDWSEAILKNKALIKKNPTDIDALNRLSFAYIQTGKFKKANKYLQMALKIDNLNTITVKNLNRIKTLQSFDDQGEKTKSKKSLDSETFIEEPGTTKSVSLKNPAPAKILSRLNAGENVRLHPKSKTVEVRTHDNIYLGALPDDIGFKLKPFISAGCQYHVCVKKVDKNSASIFIREKKRSKKLHNQPSFSS